MFKKREAKEVHRGKNTSSNNIGKSGNIDCIEAEHVNRIHDHVSALVNETARHGINSTENEEKKAKKNRTHVWSLLSK